MPDVLQNGKAAVTILFNYNTDEEKSGLTASANWNWLNTMSRRTQSIRVSYLTVKRMWRTDRGRVGQLTIQTGQSNFFNNGRYYVRVVSSAGGSALVPIHVVNDEVPTLELKETPQSGKNLHFAVSDLVRN